MARPIPTLEKFFWARVDKSEECWRWTGRYDGVGYGVVQVGRDDRRRGAHRVSWELHNKQSIPDGMVACHRCDHPWCVRPDHLFIGTQADNLRDAQIKGRLNVPGKGWAREKTHCSNGHPFDAVNTYWWGTKRICRVCRKLHERARRAKAAA